MANGWSCAEGEIIEVEKSGLLITQYRLSGTQWSGQSVGCTVLITCLISPLASFFFSQLTGKEIYYFPCFCNCSNSPECYGNNGCNGGGLVWHQSYCSFHQISHIHSSDMKVTLKDIWNTQNINKNSNIYNGPVIPSWVLESECLSLSQRCVVQPPLCLELCNNLVSTCRKWSRDELEIILSVSEAEKLLKNNLFAANMCLETVISRNLLRIVTNLLIKVQLLMKLKRLDRLNWFGAGF